MAQYQRPAHDHGAVAQTDPKSSTRCQVVDTEIVRQATRLDHIEPLRAGGAKP